MLLFPTMVFDPRAYVLIGMAGFFAGVSNTPIATLIMVSELTGNYGLIAPLMLVCTVAMIVYPRNSIYQKQVKSRVDSPVHLGEFIVDVLEGIRVETAIPYMKSFRRFPIVFNKLGCVERPSALGDPRSSFEVDRVEHRAIPGPERGRAPQLPCSRFGQLAPSPSK